MNKLNLVMNELEFDEGKHIYTLNGVQLPSVTSVINFGGNDYKGIAEDVLKKAADRGTVIHSAIETWIDCEMDTIVNEEHRGYFDAFLAWYKSKNIDPFATEQKVYHKILKYAGTIDLIAMVDGELVIVDYKTSATITNELEGSYRMQLEAYRQALKTHGVNIEKAIILHLKSDGTYREIVTGPDPDRWYKFNCGIIWYRHKHQ